VTSNGHGAGGGALVGGLIGGKKGAGIGALAGLGGGLVHLQATQTESTIVIQRTVLPALSSARGEVRCKAGG
jgi:hypothetical protein